MRAAVQIYEPRRAGRVRPVASCRGNPRVQERVRARCRSAKPQGGLALAGCDKSGQLPWLLRGITCVGLLVALLQLFTQVIVVALPLQGVLRLPGPGRLELFQEEGIALH